MIPERVTVAMRRAFKEAHASGWSLRRIADAHGVDHSTVRNHLKRARVDTAYRGRDDEAATKTKRTNKARLKRAHASAAARDLAGALRGIGRDEDADKIEAYARAMARVSL